MAGDEKGAELVPKKRAEVLKPKEGVKPIDQDILDIEAARLRNEERLGYREIAQRMGCSVSTAHTRVHRVYQDAKVEATDMMRHLERERLDGLWQHAKKIAETTYYVTAHGKVVLDPETGQPLVDPMPNLQARKEMRAIAESMRKLEGLDQPAKVEQSGSVKYEIVGVSPADMT
jgi:predicted DNA-binding protein (UPF0251 family)